MQLRNIHGLKKCGPLSDNGSLVKCNRSVTISVDSEPFAHNRSVNPFTATIKKGETYYVRDKMYTLKSRDGYGEYCDCNGDREPISKCDKGEHEGEIFGEYAVIEIVCEAEIFSTTTKKHVWFSIEHFDLIK